MQRLGAEKLRSYYSSNNFCTNSISVHLYENKFIVVDDQFTYNKWDTEKEHRRKDGC